MCIYSKVQRQKSASGLRMDEAIIKQTSLFKTWKKPRFKSSVQGANKKDSEKDFRAKDFTNGVAFWAYLLFGGEFDEQQQKAAASSLLAWLSLAGIVETGTNSWPGFV